MERHPFRGRSPAWYEIVVRGEFDERFVSAFDEMTIRCESGRTHMVGEMIDQARLFGLLDRIRNLGIELISVIPLAEHKESASASCEPVEDDSVTP